MSDLGLLSMMWLRSLKAERKMGLQRVMVDL
jgi:hypothetical protein